MAPVPFILEGVRRGGGRKPCNWGQAMLLRLLRAWLRADWLLNQAANVAESSRTNPETPSKRTKQAWVRRVRSGEALGEGWQGRHSARVHGGSDSNLRTCSRELRAQALLSGPEKQAQAGRGPGVQAIVARFQGGQEVVHCAARIKAWMLQG